MITPEQLAQMRKDVMAAFDALDQTRTEVAAVWEATHYHARLSSKAAKMRDTAEEERDKARAERDALNYKLSAFINENAEISAKAKRLAAQLATAETDVDGVWIWQGDGGDHPVSLSCPVVMSADTLRGIFDERDALKAQLATVREALGMSSPWPVLSILEKLSDAAEHLSAHHDCDCDGWETRRAAMQASDEMRPILRAALAPVKP